MSEIIGSVVDIEPRLMALAILETCVRRMRLWEAPYDLDDDIDNKIYILARCIQIVTDIIDRIEHGEED